MGALRRIVGIDPTLLLAVLLLLGASIYVLATAVVKGDLAVHETFAQRQAIFAGIGLAVMVVVSRIPTIQWQRLWLHAWAASIVLVLLVRLVGVERNGAKSWIDLGPIDVQPSELSQVLVVVALAGFLASRVHELRELRAFVAALALLGVPTALVFVQPDFGMAQIFAYTGMAILFFAGARWLHLGTLAGGAVVLVVLVLGVLPAVGVNVLHEYQKQRLVGFLDPEADPQGSNYQTIQAKIAIGSGQLTGRPPQEASQVRQAFLPEPETDFIFAALAERHGFVGGALLLGAYLLLISRLVYAVGVASSVFARLVAGGVAMLFFSQMFVNLGMVLGLLPVTGVPLPLVSYGGSSMLSGMLAIGLVAAVLREAEHPRARYQRRRTAGADARSRTASRAVLRA
jgi:rod shape determining protein RodA